MHGWLWLEATEGKVRVHPANSSACGAESRIESTKFPLEPSSAELSPCREASRKRSLNSITLSFGPAHECSNQEHHTFPQGSQHYLAN